ncbi:MAG: glycosyltransferase family 8 protein [Methanobrevibacter sp.]|nr:glycosyltransferase family 8 protein [Candidatus Methanoflexus mossambicus]
MKNNELNVCYCINHDFAPYCAVSLTSLLENNLDFKYICVYIVYDEISNVFKKKLKECVKNYFAEIIFIKFPTALNEKLLFFGKKRLAMVKDGKLSIVTYYRLFLSSLIGDNVDRVIYLDADTLVLDSFNTIWDVDLNDKVIAAVKDTNQYSQHMKSFERFIKNLNFDETIEYMNAGFLIIDLNKWREYNIEKKIFDAIPLFNWSEYCHDQGILNYVFNGNFLVLNPKYNLFSVFYVAKNYISFLGYDSIHDKSILVTAMKNPVVLHFVGYPGKPWFFKNPYNKCNDIYMKYVDLSPFDNEEVYIDKKFTFKEKLFLKLSKNMPVLYAIFDKLISR